MKTIRPGTNIQFKRSDGQLRDDIVRVVFWQETLHESGVAIILTNHSWCWASDVIRVQ